MEVKYPALGNLMPRDVIAREEWQWIKQGIQPYLDMRDIPKEVSVHKLAGVLEACHDFLALDPLKEPIPVSPGIHYFMGGLYVDVNHRTPSPTFTRQVRRPASTTAPTVWEEILF